MPRPTAHRALAALVLAVAAVAAACSPAADATPSAPAATAPSGSVAALPAEVSVAEALALRESGAFILDVREPDEWAAVHIPDATLIPLGELASRVDEVPSDRQVVVVCRSGNRSAQGRDILLDAGLPSVTSMAGGMNDWAASGYPTTSGS
jgi:rhodanese-related sulfurtransferase